MLRAKRVYDTASPTDGTRVLVMRLWPRGVRKSAIDLWLKDLGAEIGNLRAFKAGRIGWPEMRRRYLAGLRREPAASALKRLRAMAKRGRVTVLCSCADPKRCHRSLLRSALGFVLALGLVTPTAWAPPARAERGTRVDFTGARASERPELFAPTLEQFLSK